MGKARSRASSSSWITLDAGALIALDRGDRRMIAVLQAALKAKARFRVPAGVIGQAGRDGTRQAVLSRFLRSAEVDIVALDGPAAKACGALCAATRHDDVIDASVVLAAREHPGPVLTSDPSDLLRFDPALVVERV
jgi:hypothetical protein